MHPWNADHDQEEPAPELNETLAREGKEKSVLPEATLIPYEVYDELLRVTFSLENPPHLLIAFGFCWLLEWKPGEVEQELAEIQLSELLKRLEHDICNYLKEQEMAADQLHAHFEPLHQKMSRTWRMETDPETYEVDAHLLDCEIGNTTLQDYYTERGDPGPDISHWWYSIKRRVWSETQARGAGPLFEWIQLPAQKRALKNGKKV